MIGVDHLHGEDQTKTKKRLAGLAVSPGVLDKILTQEAKIRYMLHFSSVISSAQSEEDE